MHDVWYSLLKRDIIWHSSYTEYTAASGRGQWIYIAKRSRQEAIGPLHFTRCQYAMLGFLFSSLMVETYTKIGQTSQNAHLYTNLERTQITARTMVHHPYQKVQKTGAAAPKSWALQICQSGLGGSRNYSIWSIRQVIIFPCAEQDKKLHSGQFNREKLHCDISKMKCQRHYMDLPLQAYLGQPLQFLWQILWIQTCFQCRWQEGTFLPCIFCQPPQVSHPWKKMIKSNWPANS